VRRPFGDALEEVPLEPAPLVTVVAQLRFPRMLSLTTERSVGAFQEAVRVEYPIMREEQAQSIAITPAGPMVSEPSTVFQFEDVGTSWKVALSQDSLSLETSSYSTRDEFIERLGRIFVALDQVSEPGPVAVYDRLGIRYINRLTGTDAKRSRLKELLCDEVYGPLTVAEELLDDQQLVASLTQQQYKLGEHTLLARWAALPPGGILAPGIEPIDSDSWVLDADAFVDSQAPFDPVAAATIARQGAALAYDLFRWVMTEKFIVERSAAPQ
jgi:uncharacterized protein (TIGR04255 family)